MSFALTRGFFQNRNREYCSQTVAPTPQSMGACPSLVEMVGYGGHREYINTAEKKLMKLHWPS